MHVPGIMKSAIVLQKCGISGVHISSCIKCIKHCLRFENKNRASCSSILGIIHLFYEYQSIQLQKIS